ncbi:MAG: hypothetical protein IIT86_05475 [Oscillospiraceae bacterium]|nr:hypothetical protein [Oscillospiraceae bacterium]
MASVSQKERCDFLKNRTKRIIMSAAGVGVCGISVGLFKHAALGVDPFQSLMSGLDAVIPIRFGALYVLVNLVLLVVSLLADRKKIGLATIINLLFLGYIAEYSQKFFERIFPSPDIIGRFLLLVMAVIIMCLASSFYFTANLGVSTYDAVTLIWSERQSRIPFSVCRIIGDVTCVVLGAGLCYAAGFSVYQIFEVVGIGTIITAFFMGPLISFFNRKVAEPILQ